MNERDLALEEAAALVDRRADQARRDGWIEIADALMLTALAIRAQKTVPDEDEV